MSKKKLCLLFAMVFLALPLVSAIQVSSSTYSTNHSVVGVAGSKANSSSYSGRTHVFYVGGNGSASNYSGEVGVFELDTTDPVITTSLENNHQFEKRWEDSYEEVGITYSITERNFLNSSVNVTYLNGTLIAQNLSAGKSGSISFNMTEYSTIHQLNITARDTNGNYATLSRNFTLVVEPSHVIPKSGEDKEEVIPVNVTNVTTQKNIFEKLDEFGKGIGEITSKSIRWMMSESGRYYVLIFGAILLLLGAGNEIKRRRKQGKKQIVDKMEKKHEKEKQDLKQNFKKKQEDND